MSDQGSPQDNEGVSGYMLGMYAPANFDTVETPLESAIDITASGGATLTPYSQLVSNVLNREIYEIKEKTTAPASIPMNWKKKIREFMITKNSDIVNSLKSPLPPNSPAAKAEVFLVKFGRKDFQANHASLDHVSLDISGSSHMKAIEEELKVIGPSSPQQIIEQVKYLYDAYRQAGDNVLRQENQLRMNLDVLDKLYQKVIAFCSLPENPESEKLAEAIESYIRSLMNEYKIEEQYNKTKEAHRKFMAYKEMLSIFRFSNLLDKEPMCMICLEDTVAYTLNPCGHTFCPSCVRKQVSTCYMCRTQVKDRIKIFFG